jgi:hypothetical protein
MENGSPLLYNAEGLSVFVYVLPKVEKWWSWQKGKTLPGLQIQEPWSSVRGILLEVDHSLCLTFQPNASRIFPRVPEDFLSLVGPGKSLN